MNYISQRLNYFDSSDFINAIQRQSLIANPIDLSIGIPEEITPEHVKAAGIKAIQEDKTIYTPTNGMLDLRVAIANKLSSENGVLCTAENISVVPGLTTGQLLMYLALIDPGDEVVVFDPYYPPYPHLASMVGGRVVYVSTLPTFHPDLGALQAAITDKTKVIVINSPNNPTGAVYTEHELRQIAEIASHHNILIISDEIYEHFTYDTKHFSIGSIYPNTITMNGFSKEYAMTGWRLGYICAPLEIITAINSLQQYVVMSSSSIAQHAALAALKHRPILEDKYRKKRDYLTEELTRIGFDVRGAEGAFYIFVKTPNDITDVDFVERAAKRDLIIVPGRAFSNMHGYVRISYGADMATLKRGVKAMESVFEDMHVLVSAL